MKRFIYLKQLNFLIHIRIVFKSYHDLKIWHFTNVDGIPSQVVKEIVDLNISRLRYSMNQPSDIFPETI